MAKCEALRSSCSDLFKTHKVAKGAALAAAVVVVAAAVFAVLALTTPVGHAAWQTVQPWLKAHWPAVVAGVALVGGAVLIGLTSCKGKPAAASDELPPPPPVDNGSGHRASVVAAAASTLPPAAADAGPNGTPPPSLPSVEAAPSGDPASDGAD